MRFGSKIPDHFFAINSTRPSELDEVVSQEHAHSLRRTAHRLFEKLPFQASDQDQVAMPCSFAVIGSLSLKGGSGSKSGRSRRLAGSVPRKDQQPVIWLELDERYNSFRANATAATVGEPLRRSAPSIAIHYSLMEDQCDLRTSFSFCRRTGRPRSPAMRLNLCWEWVKRLSSEHWTQLAVANI